MLVALLEKPDPPIIGGLLPPLAQRRNEPNVGERHRYLSGRAVEAAGDVDVLLLDKTGTITPGNRRVRFYTRPRGGIERTLATPRSFASLADETPEGRVISRSSPNSALTCVNAMQSLHATFCSVCTHKAV